MSDTDSTVVETTVVIMGAGFAGVCLGIKLGRAGIPFVILEKASAVGGVWRDNIYPGAACDVPSHL
jgi:cation diffusion facilitator CzcD-associated flavoprotein CzcO